MAELKDRPEEDVRILDDSPIEAAPYRLGAVFDLYHDGTGVKFVATEIVERGGRRIVYGVPRDRIADADTSA